ncbi:hypothetical protein [Calidifontibacter terrae]
MTWLTIQTVAWCLIGFCVGALAAWLLAVMLFPHENEVASQAMGSEAPRSESTDAEADA